MRVERFKMRDSRDGELFPILGFVALPGAICQLLVREDD